MTVEEADISPARRRHNSDRLLELRIKGSCLCRRRNKQNLFGDFVQLPRRTPRGGSIDGAHAAQRAARAPYKTEILYDSPASGSLRVWRLFLRTVGLGGGYDGGCGCLGGSISVAATRRSAQFATAPRRTPRGVSLRQSPAAGGKSAAAANAAGNGGLRRRERSEPLRARGGRAATCS